MVNLAASLFRKFMHMSLALLPDAHRMLQGLMERVMMQDKSTRYIGGNGGEMKNCEKATMLLRDLS